MSSDIQSLEEAIHSIYHFKERTAEKTATGTTWTTIDYENKPQHDISVFNGVGGIPFFLNDYYRQYGNEAALELSQRRLIGAPIFKESISSAGCILDRLELL